VEARLEPDVDADDRPVSGPPREGPDAGERAAGGDRDQDQGTTAHLLGQLQRRSQLVGPRVRRILVLVGPDEVGLAGERLADDSQPAQQEAALGVRLRRRHDGCVQATQGGDGGQWRARIDDGGEGHVVGTCDRGQRHPQVPRGGLDQADLQIEVTGHRIIEGPRGAVPRSNRRD